MKSPVPLYGCIEAGGTKFVVGIARSPDAILETARFETTTPDATIGAAISWLKEAATRHGLLSAIGIASFGPLELDRTAANWGFITGTPKAGWSQTDFAARVERELGLPVGFDTDVSGAALAEARWGAGQGQGQGQSICVYVTIGTGIGGGVVVGDKPLCGLSHPEMGHMRLARHPADMGFAGVCPFHGDCLEGLASGPAIKARWGASLSELGPDHIGHEIIASYLAQMSVTLQSILEPGKIILGGGVMETLALLARVRAEATRLGANYFRGKAQDVIVTPKLGNRAGLLGGLALAMDRLRSL
jgi:fructokinase